MAFAEQQHWITVQQKTFTKWLNTKIDARGLEVKDLVKDLSDGVRLSLFCFLCLLLDPLLRVHPMANTFLANRSSSSTY